MKNYLTKALDAKLDALKAQSAMIDDDEVYTIDASSSEIVMYVELMKKAVEDGLISEADALEKAKKDLSNYKLVWTTTAKGKFRRWRKINKVSAIHKHPTDKHAEGLMAFDRIRRFTKLSSAVEYVRRHYGDEIADYVSGHHEERKSKSKVSHIARLKSSAGISKTDARRLADELRSGVQDSLNHLNGKSLAYSTLAVYFSGVLASKRSAFTKQLLDSAPKHNKMLGELYLRTFRDVRRRIEVFSSISDMEQKESELRSDFARRRIGAFMAAGIGKPRCVEEVAALIAADNPTDIRMNPTKSLTKAATAKAETASKFISSICDVSKVSTGFVHTRYFKYPPKRKDTVLGSYTESSALTGSPLITVYRGAEVDTYSHELMHHVEHSNHSVMEASLSLRDSCSIFDKNGDAVVEKRGDSEFAKMNKLGESLFDDAYPMRLYRKSGGTEIASRFVTYVIRDIAEMATSRDIYFDSVLNSIQ